MYINTPQWEREREREKKVREKEKERKNKRERETQSYLIWMPYTTLLHPVYLLNGLIEIFIKQYRSVADKIQGMIDLCKINRAGDR